MLFFLFQQALKSRQKDSSHLRQHRHQANSQKETISNITRTSITNSIPDHRTVLSPSPPIDVVNNSKFVISLDSRSASPRDTGLAVSSANGSDGENDLKSNDSVSVRSSPPAPTVANGGSFRNSLAFFQRAAHLVANNARNAQSGQ